MRQPIFVCVKSRPDIEAFVYHEEPNVIYINTACTDRAGEKSAVRSAFCCGMFESKRKGQGFSTLTIRGA